MRPYNWRSSPILRPAISFPAPVASARCDGPRRAGGKRGGIRVIYYLRSRQGLIWMLTVYSKAEATTIPAHVLKKIKGEIDGQS